MQFSIKGMIRGYHTCIYKDIHVHIRDAQHGERLTCTPEIFWYIHHASFLYFVWIVHACLLLLLPTVGSSQIKGHWDLVDCSLVHKVPFFSIHVHGYTYFTRPFVNWYLISWLYLNPWNQRKLTPHDFTNYTVYY